MKLQKYFIRLTLCRLDAPELLFAESGLCCSPSRGPFSSCVTDQTPGLRNSSTIFTFPAAVASSADVRPLLFLASGSQNSYKSFCLI